MCNTDCAFKSHNLLNEFIFIPMSEKIKRSLIKIKKKRHNWHNQIIIIIIIKDNFCHNILSPTAPDRLIFFSS